MGETVAAGTVITRTGGVNAGAVSVHPGGKLAKGFRVSSLNRAAGIVGRSKNVSRDLSRAVNGRAASAARIPGIANRKRAVQRQGKR